jgi:hypothetical protein
MDKGIKKEIPDSAQQEGVKEIRFGKIIFLTIFCFSILSCQYFKSKEGEGKVLAKVNGKSLSIEDIKDIIPPKASSRDCLDVLNRYVKSWVMKQLLLKQAEANLKYNEAEVERKLLDYKYALLVYEYEKKYVAENLDTTVTEKEIQSYYKENIDNFELKQNIIKGIFVKLPKKTPRKDRIIALIKEQKKNYEAIHSFCYRFASDYVLADTTWNNFEELIANSAFSNIPDKVQFLKKTKFAELSDSVNTYLLSIEDFKIEDQNAPYEFVKPQIQNIIINKRKLTQVQKLERDIYNKALKNKDVEIFTENK